MTIGSDVYVPHLNLDIVCKGFLRRKQKLLRLSRGNFLFERIELGEQCGRAWNYQVLTIEQLRNLKLRRNVDKLLRLFEIKKFKVFNVQNMDKGNQ